jgi:superfamily II DNA or RNA helicase
MAASLEHLPVLILATRTRLVRQIHERLNEFGVGHGVVAAELREYLDLFQPVQVASADTIYRRCLAGGHMPLPPARVVIFDECHLAGANTRAQILEQYSSAVTIGFTATPARKSGRSLCEVFDELILGPTTQVLIDAGMLVKPRIFSVPVLSESELRDLPKDTSADYAVGETARVMSRPKLVGDVVLNWQRIAAGLPTIIFVCNKAQGAETCDRFTAAGIAAELITDSDDEETREAAIGRLERGETTIIINCFLMSYGVDIPSVKVIVLARPTRSLAMFLQMVGRGMRPAAGKDSVIIIDHGRVIESLGLPTDDFNWSLDEDRNVNQEAREAAERRQVVEKPMTCPECSSIWLASEMGTRCSQCGWAPRPIARPVIVRDAELHELGSATAPAAAISPSSPEVVSFFTQAVTWYANHWPARWQDRPNGGRGWAWIKTKERFKIPEVVKIPRRFWEISPAPVTPEVGGWLHSRHIRDTRSRRPQGRSSWG